ncbi:hypothetical protein [Nocardioides sp. SYSU DS0663]|uniref:hypothetical protein n=1 Tax=Nocardioides sp. SYSU DS0663 TaxID=3416445 RepID=UPI003F4BEE05
MDANDRAVQEELQRRLAVIDQETSAGHSRPLPRADLLAFVLIIVVAALVGVVAGAV